MSKPDMDTGRQPIDDLMLRRGLSNHDVVAAAAGSGLTHKQVAKARRGRRLTSRVQEKILCAINQLSADQPIRHEECFNYRGR